MNNKLLEAIRQTLQPTTLEKVREGNGRVQVKASHYRLVRGDVATYFDMIEPESALLRSASLKT